MVRQPGQKTKHAQIFEFVHAGIMSGRYKTGQRVPSETQLCIRFGTTRATVSKALRDLEMAGFLDRRPGSGSYVRLPARSQSKLLALLVPNLIDGEIFAPMCGAIATAVRTYGFTLVWGQSAADNQADKGCLSEELCRQYIAQKVDGVFFNPIELERGMEEVNRRITDLLDRAGIPVVLLDSDMVKYPRRSRYDLVGLDNRRVGCAIAEHFLAQGCRRIDFVHRPLSAATIDARIAGYQEALRSHGIAPQPEWIHCGEVGDLEYVRQIVGDHLPDAYVCGNDYTAAQLMRNLLNLGWRVPEDVCIAGVDDLKYASLLSVPLTTIHQPCAALGTAAVDAMIQRIERPNMPARDTLLDFHLVERCSSQRPTPPDTATSAPSKPSKRRTSRRKAVT